MKLGRAACQQQLSWISHMQHRTWIFPNLWYEQYAMLCIVNWAKLFQTFVWVVCIIRFCWVLSFFTHFKGSGSQPATASQQPELPGKLQCYGGTVFSFLAYKLRNFLLMKNSPTKSVIISIKVWLSFATCVLLLMTSIHGSCHKQSLVLWSMN